MDELKIKHICDLVALMLFEHAPDGLTAKQMRDICSAMVCSITSYCYDNNIETDIFSN